MNDDQSIDLQRLTRSLRRNAKLIALVVILLTGAVVGLSLLRPAVYTSSASIVVATDDALGTADAATVERDLATTQTLLTTRRVLAAAARAVPGTTVGQLEDDVSSSVDTGANIITIEARASGARRAAALANAVAKAFITQRQAEVRATAERSQALVTGEITRLRGLSATAPGDTSLTSRITALEGRLDALAVSAAGSGTGLQLIESAQVPTQQTSPRPVRNALVALFVSLFLGVLLALARDQLKPRLNDQRELARLLGLPVLAGIPLLTRRNRAETVAAEYESYQSLAASLRLALPPDRQHVVLITSGSHGEGKTTVAARLGRLLAQAGVSTLLVSGDLRRPRLDTIFGVEGRIGFYDLLARSSTRAGLTRNLLKGAVAKVGVGREQLSIVPAGHVQSDASALLARSQLEDVFRELRLLEHRFIIVDAPPAFGVADTQVLAQMCDHVLVVARLDRANVTVTVDLRERLQQMGVEPVGLVVLGTKRVDSPYYLTEDMPEVVKTPSA